MGRNKVALACLATIMAMATAACRVPIEPPHVRPPDDVHPPVPKPHDGWHKPDLPYPQLTDLFHTPQPSRRA
ncbi:hypothetical protein HTZ77_34280 [Nonomuraea sp. SMC257]|uniref:Lipoprotein n=1 Tax=Nonomuraea montanisoli TaxID=2741721 RepID=A0A7Y6IE50_9ACTN|nr:hypothetical protein [Nonomuraea montanisoli]NUW36441.1 hypothetical protein [Nonomuraea montanisoli]